MTGDLGCGSGISVGVFIETLLITRPARGHVAGCRPRHAGWTEISWINIAVSSYSEFIHQ